MKKVISLTVIIFAVSIGVWFGISFVSRTSIKGVQSTPTALSTNIQEDSGTHFVPENKKVSEPINLSISKIGVNASVESVGMDSQGRMDVPKNEWDVAWYNLGVKPGEKGNAVIAGHLDSQTGPAVFWNLSELQPGDLITVTDKDENTYTYKVIDTVSYKFDQFPLEEVFGGTDKSRLNLITCGGLFNGVTKNYSHRAVVYSELTR